MTILQKQINSKKEEKELNDSIERGYRDFENGDYTTIDAEEFIKMLENDH